MGFKTIFIIVVSVLVTIILMNNTDEVNFWIFGDSKIPKLTILGVMFGLGLIVGYLAGRPRRKELTSINDSPAGLNKPHSDTAAQNADYLSEEDRDYIR